MNKTVLQSIEKSRAKVIVLDIDGTLKDLCTEHTTALQITLQSFDVSVYRKKLILLINKIAMSMVKTGLFSTNHSKQNLLIKIYAILSGVKINTFSKEYFKSYTEQICLFEGATDLLNSLNSEKLLYFSTINKQNYNLEECGIPQERIIYTEGKFKVSTYREILKSIGVNKEDVVIIGDNIFDDLLSAKLLGVKCLLVNHYDSKLKAMFCKLVNSKY